MKKITIPEWFRTLPGNAYLNSTDLINLFCYKYVKSVTGLVNRGLLPKPTMKCSRLTSYRKSNMWKVSEVREFIKNNIDNQKGKL